ncbi:ribosomal protein S18 acetylase RimI-like enzyme [Variovorax paradoxus]|jgi:ribosomal protein S18 acetylase RimI-like enzyme|uniref:GNAT family N-acetyltransferase n=1 Tax=Variovorax paradoxus TaxID=34073 RepID=UPI00278B1D99|nr:GNAT family N-acetyltransferase [Variovorax paradoxus]MDP9931797.1 ribosomal protein S18 acetylase RimI-like enzyme [Variovorax paradoxus]MDQ0025994.1 ribosomal protein S18 acetylase RimI-like enzyme [Variovorax paradoxus]
MNDVEAIERATVAAVSPLAVEELDGWLLPFDDGTVKRARSAVPLHRGEVSWHTIDRIEDRYDSRQFVPAFRLADVPCFAALQAELEQRHYVGDSPTCVQVGSARRMRDVGAAGAALADVDLAPDEAWATLFLGEGFDPVDGAHRVRALSRAKGSLYASVRDGRHTVAAGAMAFGHGWASVHGMRTEQSQRGRGLARRVLAGLAQAALERGFERVFLQVDAHNAAAHALYRRAGFSTQWQYRYWQRQQWPR